MADPALSLEALAQLPSVKLAQLIFEAAEDNAPLRKRAISALVALQGPQALTKLIDRRLGALERSYSYIGYDRLEEFCEDLASLVGAIATDLGDLSATLAIERLLRFIQTHERVFDRVDDSYGHVQSVFEAAIADLGTLVPRLSAEDASLLSDKVMKALDRTDHGYLIDVAKEIVPHLSEVDAQHWDRALSAALDAQMRTAATEEGRSVNVFVAQYKAVKQIIATRLGDLDGFIALEAQKSPQSQNRSEIATRLLEAGRAPEALDWIRRPRGGGLKVMTLAAMADRSAPQDYVSLQDVSLEARILDALGEGEAAQSLRWSGFERSLKVGVLREYLAHRADFDDGDALERAFATALASENTYAALDFFLEWPKLDLANEIILKNQSKWDGAFYFQLLPAAEALEVDYPLAASLLYRALLDKILATARSKAYAHAARYLEKLDAMAPELPTEALDGLQVMSHADYHDGLKKTHGRKTAFWMLVDRR